MPRRLAALAVHAYTASGALLGWLALRSAWDHDPRTAFFWLSLTVFVDATDGFYVIAGHNPGVHGAILTEALASRFDVHIEVTTDWKLARHLGVPRPAIEAAKALNQSMAEGRISWAPQLRELLGFARVAKTLGHAAAIANLAGRAPEADRPAVIDTLNAHFATTVTPLRLGDQR